MKKMFLLVALCIPVTGWTCSTKDVQCSDQLVRSYEQLRRESWILRQCAAKSCQDTHQEKADRIRDEIARLESKR